MWPRVNARLDRRCLAVLDYIREHPHATRTTDYALRHLDDLVGEADRLRRDFR